MSIQYNLNTIRIFRNIDCLSLTDIIGQRIPKFDHYINIEYPYAFEDKEDSTSNVLCTYKGVKANLTYRLSVQKLRK